MRKLFSNNPTRRIINVIIPALTLGLASLSGGAWADGATVTFGVEIPETPVLEIVLKDAAGTDISGGSTTMQVTPRMATAGFNSSDISVSVGTSSPAGYNLKMYADSTDLTSGTNTIPTLGEGTFTCTAATANDCSFTANAWGYKKSTAENYLGVPLLANAVELSSSDAPTNAEETVVTFGSRINAYQPAGTYTTTINFVATANPTTMTIADISTLQDFATLSTTDFYDVLDSMTTGTAYEKADSRDSKTYNIAKLADGNIWFLDNLRLDPNVTTLTSANTNVTATPSVTFINKTSSWSGDSAFTQAWYNLDSENTEQSYGSGKNKVGGYYNFCAASAGSYCYGSSAGTGNASQDLCPAGWRIPTGGSGGEYATLTQAITGTSGNLGGTDRTNFMNAAHIALSGFFWDASALNRGSLGYFWSSSSTFSSTSYMYYLNLNGSTVFPTNDTNRNSGFSIRCVAKAGTEMQNLSTSTVARKLQNVNDVTSLIDLRDYQPYTVAKLADGKIWMTKNLNLPGGTEIESIKSDVPSGYSLPTANGFGVGNTLPASATAGFNDNAKAFVYNSGSTTCASGSPCYSYYSWTAATAASGLTLGEDNVDAPYSICPKGWKLPNTRTGTDSSSDFRALMIAYGGSSAISDYTDTTTPTGAVIYNKIGSSANVPNFPLNGAYNGGSFTNGGLRGYYWSSTFLDNSHSRDLFFGSTIINSAASGDSKVGMAVRCLFAN